MSNNKKEQNLFFMIKNGIALKGILVAALILAGTICYFLLRQETYPESPGYDAEKIHKDNNITGTAENIRKHMTEKKRTMHGKDYREPLEPAVKEQTETGGTQEPVLSSEEDQHEPNKDENSIEEEEEYLPEEPVKKKGILSENNWRENTTDMEFSWVPGGRYEMGCGDWTGNCDNDEHPAHEEVVDGFWMGRHEVTAGQYMVFAKKTDSHYPPWMEQGNEFNIITGSDSYYKSLGKSLVSDNYPVVGISWSNAAAFAEWLSQETGYIFRLPTEAEWEYACRSRGENAEYGTSTGSMSPKLANYNPGDYIEDDYGWTAPVGSFPHNQLRIYDMSGNVWEWCLDVYDTNAYKAAGSMGENSVYLESSHSVYENNLPDILTDLKNSDRTRVIRGGSWCTGSGDMRCTNRRSYSQFGEDFCVGFRLIRVP